MMKNLKEKKTRAELTLLRFQAREKLEAHLILSRRTLKVWQSISVLFLISFIAIIAGLVTCLMQKQLLVAAICLPLGFIACGVATPLLRKISNDSERLLRKLDLFRLLIDALDVILVNNHGDERTVRQFADAIHEIEALKP